MKSNEIIRNHDQNEKRISRSELGQSIVFIAIVLLALLMLLALVIDGGFSYATRRSAQNAADAGAYAGVQDLCKNLPASTAYNDAYKYAVTLNKASRADIDIAYKTITVTAYITITPFFSGVLNRDQEVISAVAASKCSPPSAAEGIMPVAWACNPPVAGLPSDSEDCEMKYNELYVFMDSKDVNQDFNCAPPYPAIIPSGYLDCDLNNDGINEALASGSRSWLDLDGGGGGASSLSDWILNGFSGTVREHTWYGGQSGVAVSIFHTTEQIVGNIVLLPVFDAYCAGDPRVTAGCDFHNTITGKPYSSDLIILTPAASQLYYHVISFAALKITCVNDQPSQHCPGHDAVVAANHALNNNLKSIEGYFIEGYMPGIGGGEGDADTGVYDIKLIK